MSAKIKAQKASGKGERIIIGTAAAMLSLLAMLLVYALLIKSGKLGTEKCREIIIGLNVMAGLICGAAAAGKTESRRGITAIISGAVFALAVIILAAMINVDLMKLAEMLRIFACSVAGALVGSMLHLGKSNKKFRKKRK